MSDCQWENLQHTRVAVQRDLSYISTVFMRGRQKWYWSLWIDKRWICVNVTWCNGLVPLPDGIKPVHQSVMTSLVLDSEWHVSAIGDFSVISNTFLCITVTSHEHYGVSITSNSTDFSTKYTRYQQQKQHWPHYWLLVWGVHSNRWVLLQMAWKTFLLRKTVPMGNQIWKIF